jgi:hypothetical protein
MSMTHIVRNLPEVDDTQIHCPGCGQTLDTIRDGGLMLPMAHYPQPTANSHGVVSVRTVPSGNGQAALCPLNGDELIAVVFRAQIAAAELDRRTAA